MNRQPGYYWVKIEDQWMIAEYNGIWLYMGTEEFNEGEDIDEIDERRIERQEQYGPSPITVIKRAFDAGMSAATYNGYPGMPDAPQFEEWYKKWKSDPDVSQTKNTKQVNDKQNSYNNDKN